MESVVQNVRDIESSEKQWLESLLGHHLEDDQQVFIMVLTPGVLPDDEARRRAAASMEDTFAQADAHARKQGVTPEEADAAVEEAMGHVRRRKGG